MTTQETISDFNTRYSTALASEYQSERDKILVLVQGLALITDLGGIESDAVKTLTTDAGIKGTFTDRFAYAAQLITGQVIDAESDAKKKVKRRNVVRVAAQFMGGLDAARSSGALTATDPEAIVDWVIAEEGMVKVARKYDTKPTGDNDNGDEAFDDAPYRAAVQTNAISIPVAAGLINAAQPTLGIHMRDGDELRLVPLTLPTSVWETVLPFLPAADANASAEAKFWRYVADTCQLFDHADSSLPLHPDEEQHLGSKKLPCRPIILLCDGSLSIASSRVGVGIVVEVDPAVTMNLGDKEVGNWHINGTGTNALVAKMLDPNVRGSIVGISTNSAGRLEFSARKKSGVSDFSLAILPMSAFGSTRDQWTLAVRDFEATGVTSVKVDGGITESLTKFATKASGSKHPVKVSILDGKLSVKLGQSQKTAIDGAAVNGSGEADIASSDLARVMELLARMPVKALFVEVDPRGLVLFRATTDLGVFSFYVPKLVDGARSPALLTEVRKPTEQHELAA